MVVPYFRIHFSIFMLKFCVAIIMVALSSGCKEGKNKQVTVTEQPEEKVNSVLNVDTLSDNIGRTVWQKPDLVLNTLGNLENKVVADIGAGTGYFSFRLAMRAKKVIAIDIDKDVLDTIGQYTARLPEPFRQRVETRLALPNNPSLSENEVDVIVIINTIAYIPALDDYLKTLLKGLKKGGEILIVDFKMKRLSISAPPRNERIYLDIMEDKLEKSGFKNIVSDDTSLDYQYIVKARKP
ncbi:MAG: class I SAM-dependent methyltransferase [Saprospiraceae bacterium]|nr:class I SAM-dependent methyltransferase [Saprospiraceae bacterium]MBK8372624.1 class I SAM-dependent methyltransferase [Saprospiraceae bacterium]MBK8549378.1 class I SAM-dependent methyltransferase [Saprospiraceae bacterium]MBK8819763.1 class I SAM-dependent methyltransferase [Saprospiraceae bacterium]MBK8855223.1 class I SAM-dependent methyltransferase [Saprospiraceae bacterium]